MQRLQIKLQPNLGVSPYIMLGRVLRANILTLAPGELESFLHKVACENLCVSVTSTKQTTNNLDFEYSLPIPARTNARVQITNELALSLPIELAEKAGLLVENLDDWGFMAKPVDQLSNELELPSAETKMMIDHLKSVKPGGIGSANLAGFLLWQVNQLPDSPMTILARRFILEYFGLLVKLNIKSAASKLSCPINELVSVYQQVILRLKPYPLALENSKTVVADPCAAFKVEANGKLSWKLCGGKNYHVNVLRPSAFLAGQQQPDGAGFMAALRRDNSWAQTLAQALVERSQIQERLMDDLMAYETDFLRGSAEFPLGRSQSACSENLQLSPSSLSRFVNANSIILPSGKIQWFRSFFEPQGKLRNAIWEELSDGCQHSLCSDNELAERIAGRGLVVSRRTVTKYREKLGFDNSYIRRRRAELDAISDIPEED